MFSQQEIGCTNAKVLAAVSRWSAMKDTGSSWMMFKVHCRDPWFDKSSLGNSHPKQQCLRVCFLFTSRVPAISNKQSSVSSCESFMFQYIAGKESQYPG